MKKRLLGTLLALCMILSLLPTAAMAAFDVGSAPVAGKNSAEKTAQVVLLAENGLAKSAKPETEDTIGYRASATATSVVFTLTNMPAGEYKAYADNGKTTVATNVSFDQNNKTVTFTGAPVPPGVFYITVTEPDKAESDTLELRVRKASGYEVKAGEPAGVTKNGTTARVEPPMDSGNPVPQEPGSEVNVQVPFAGTPVGSGRHSVALTGEGVSTPAQTVTVQTNVAVDKTLTFKFTMPAKEVTLNITHTFIPMYEYTLPMDFSKPAGTGDDNGNWVENATLATHGYHWDAASQTLQLKDIIFSCADTDTALTLPAGATLVLAESSVSSVTGKVNGVYGKGALTVTGSGTLTAHSNNNGIHTDGVLTINGGIIIADAGSKEVAEHNGINCRGLNISGGAVTTTGTGSNSYGIISSEMIHISSGTVNATGGLNGISSTHPNDIIISGGSVTAVGTGDATDGKANGLNCSGNLTISGGTVNAKGTRTAVWGYTGLNIAGMTVTKPVGGVVGSSVNDQIENKTNKAILINGKDALEVSLEPAPYLPDMGGSYVPPVKDTVESGKDVASSDLGALSDSGKSLTVIGADGAKLVLDHDCVKALAKDGGKLVVTVADAGDKLTARQKELAAGRPVFDLTATLNGKSVTAFGGTVTVTVPYTLKAGEKAQEVAVWYLAEDGTLTEIPAVYDAKTGLATFRVTHFSKYVVGVEPWVNPFADVKAGDWYLDAVQYANRRGLFSGVTDTAFAPDATMTRQMLWTVLGRLDGQTLFGEQVYGEARVWAMGKGITDGSDPTGEITREQLVTILWRYAGSPVSGGKLDSFSDTAHVADYALSAMVWAVEKGLVQGTEGALLPQGNATRAQVAAILMRYDHPAK